MPHIPTPTFEIRPKFIIYKFILLIFIFLKNDVNVSCSNNVPSEETTTPSNIDDLLKDLPPEEAEPVRNLVDKLQNEEEANTRNKIANIKNEIAKLRAEDYHPQFVASMTRMSAHLDSCFRFFRLNSIKLPRTTSYDHFPSSVRHILEYSDIGYAHIAHPLRQMGGIRGRFGHEKPHATNQSFVKWCLVLQGGSRIKLPKLAEKLRKKVNCYYEANKDKHVGESDYYNITVFNHYFAAVMTRLYNLGKLVEHDLIVLLYLKDFEDTSTKENKYFLATLLRHMPYWYLTEEHLDLLNILFGVFHFGPMQISLKFRNRLNQTVVIPKMEWLKNR